MKDERSPGRDSTLRSARTRWAWPGSSQALVASGQVGCESQRERSGSAQVRQVLVALRPGFSGCAGGKPLGFCHCECDPGGYLSFGWLRQERGSSQVGRARREAGAGAAGCPEHGTGDPDPVGSRRGGPRPTGTATQLLRSVTFTDLRSGPRRCELFRTLLHPWTWGL